MDEEKCRVQILLEALTDNRTRRIDDALFTEVKDAYNNCLSMLWIEEKLNIVSGNFYEWEQEIKESYDFFIRTQSDSPDCNKNMYEHGTKEIIVLNRRFFNVLNSIRMYRDQVMHDLLILGNEFKVKFEKETNVQYDKTFSYQIMELFRNYMQHQGLVIERITAIIPFSRKIGDELWYFAEADYDNVRNIEKFEQKIKCKPNGAERIKWINLIGLLREYYAQILELHFSYRSITDEIFCKSVTSIEKAVKKVYGNLDVKQISFFGKKDDNRFQDFLLQMIYIDRLKHYRKTQLELDASQSYIGKKCIFESDKIRVSNSARHNFRFNKS